MLSNRIEGKWIDCFERVFALCKIARGDEIAILSETQSRQINVQLAELALHRLGARPFHVIVPTPRLETSIPIRSTGASNAVQQLGPVIRALSSSVAVIDVTVEGMLHSVELAEILAGGTRLYMISNEHPELLERLMPNPALRPKVEAGAAMMRNAREMRVLSEAGPISSSTCARPPASAAIGASRMRPARFRIGRADCAPAIRAAAPSTARW